MSELPYQPLMGVLPRLTDEQAKAVWHLDVTVRLTPEEVAAVIASEWFRSQTTNFRAIFVSTFARYIGSPAQAVDEADAAIRKAARSGS